MDEKGILKLLEEIGMQLDSVKTAIEKDEWDTVSQQLSLVNKSQEKIRTNPIPVDTFLEKNREFKEQYNILKPVILKKTEEVITRIQGWQTKQMGKIADSKNILDNFARYYQPNNRSYYFDREE